MLPLQCRCGQVIRKIKFGKLGQYNFISGSVLSHIIGDFMMATASHSHGTGGVHWTLVN